MVWWIAGGIAGLALIGLGVAVLSAVASLRELGQAMRTLQRRLDDGAQRLQPRLTELNERVLALPQPALSESDSQQYDGVRGNSRQ